MWWIAAGAVVALATASYLYVSLTYRLEHGHMWSVGDGAVFDERNPRSIGFHPLRPGYELRIAITVRNPGKLTVALDNVTLDNADMVIEELTMIEDAEQDLCCRAEDAKPFHPIDLRAGGEVAVWLALRVSPANPYSPCTGFTLESAGLRYQVMGITRSQRLALRSPIVFRSPCP